MLEILKIPNKILIRKFNIEFSYLTRRKNRRLRTVEIKSTSREDAEFWFNQWLMAHNNKNKDMSYDNAKILSCEEIEREVIEIK